jgi:DNA polymerase III delta prime subunit
MQNNKTTTLLASFTKKPSSSLILEGNEALGANECVQTLSKNLLGDRYSGNKLAIEPVDDKSIGIEVVRELKNRMATIAGKDQPISRVVYILQAEKLTTEAQNALLKLIEEPTKNTLLVLVVSDRTQLLETIQSRCQTIQILPITKHQAQEYCQANNIDDATCQRSYLLSQGASTLFQELAHGRNSALTENIQKAKEFLSQKTFARLSRQKEFDTADNLRQLLSSLQTIAEAGLHGSNGKANIRWQSIIKELRKSANLLQSNANAKLIFLRMSIMV